jgi:7,8-dihydropterin-6-yl-methyl-4-(beta-D-ribofuranosyl)aminobenzene 5'-phosphate synthase
MGLDASAIDFLVLSHEHGDHTGGISSFIKMKTDIPVIIPHSFTMAFKKKMDVIISGMKSLGVVKCGATHCTGDEQIKMFRDAFGENYFELGAGNTFVIN